MVICVQKSREFRYSFNNWPVKANNKNCEFPSVILFLFFILGYVPFPDRVRSNGIVRTKGFPPNPTVIQKKKLKKTKQKNYQAAE